METQQWALAIFRQRIGPWRATRAEAEEDAVRTGNGSRDRQSMTVYLTVPADLLSRTVVMKEEWPMLKIVGGKG